MVSHAFGVEINQSKPKPTPMAQLIMDLRKLGKGTSPSVNGPEQLRDHLERQIAALGAIQERTEQLIADEAEAAKPASKRKATKGKDRQETGGTNRSDSD